MNKVVHIICDDGCVLIFNYGDIVELANDKTKLAENIQIEDVYFDDTKIVYVDKHSKRSEPGPVVVNIVNVVNNYYGLDKEHYEQ